MAPTAAAGMPRWCIATQPTPSSAASGARPPATSLSRVAPASTAARATPGFTVSTEIRAVPASAATTGTTRRRSSSSGTALAPGRVDSPPTSRIDAPSAARARPSASAASALDARDGAKNESGVTFTTPITAGASVAT